MHQNCTSGRNFCMEGKNRMKKTFVFIYILCFLLTNSVFVINIFFILSAFLRKFRAFKFLCNHILHSKIYSGRLSNLFLNMNDFFHFVYDSVHIWKPYFFTQPFTLRKMCKEPHYTHSHGQKKNTRSQKRTIHIYNLFVNRLKVFAINIQFSLSIWHSCNVFDSSCLSLLLNKQKNWNNDQIYKKANILHQ